MPRNDEFLYRLRNANTIESVMGGYVQLIRRGRNYVCSCPFHSEKTPSCTVFTDTQNFYCFGCGTGGDVITFIMKIENLDFKEAVKLLAQRSGMEVPAYNSADSRLAQRKTRIYEMNRIAANYFYTNLVKGQDKSGLKYFYDRKLSPAVIKKYGLGYAPDSWHDLSDLLRSKGYTDDEIIDAWLGGRSQKTGKSYDMFRKRVMFPIIDLRGNIIGFGGRVLDDSKPKYLNTSATPVFDKGSNLFSMNFAKNAETKRIILCEGYMDVIAVNQAGFENVVATLGTAITPDQARLISHYAEEVVIAYDSDGAGQKAAQKAINHFSDVGIRTRVLRMEGAKDPDEYIKKFGAESFRLLIEGSADATDFMLDKCEVGIDMSSEAGKVELLRRTSKVLAGIESPLEREVYISRTARKCDIPVQVLKTHIDGLLRRNERSGKKREWKNIQLSAVKHDQLNPEADKSPREAKAEEAIISYLIRNPGEYADIAAEAPPDTFVTPFNKRVYHAVLGAVERHENFSVSMLSDEFTLEETGRITGITAKFRDHPVTREYFSDCAAVLRKHTPASTDGISDDDLKKLFDSKKK
ncbi:MAG: DNA primase [Ruminococcus sp.]|nr:DNA primase [Ruminococcus sp.]